MPDRRPLITLLTDFGTTDTYVGQVKGVIAGICPEVTVVDLTHEVLPQQVEQGAFLLETAIGAFPAGTIHVAVVDPGVGTDRVGLLIRADGRIFVGPDNGLLSIALPEALRPETAKRVALPEDVRAHALIPDPGRTVAPTFHGRDIFAVAAARLARADGTDIRGGEVREMLALPPFRATSANRRTLTARVIHIDRFGNVITTVRASQLARATVTGAQPVVTIGSHRISRFVGTYAQSEGLVALIGSGGYLEVAEVHGNAAVRIGARIGQDVRVDLGR